MYGRMLATSGKDRFLDKTPAYALVHEFVTRLYPRARYVVLTRHPLAVMSSFAATFFEGDWKRAHEFNPIVERYVPAIAKFIRRSRDAGGVPTTIVRYEDLIEDASGWLRRLFEFLGLEHEEGAIEYGKHQHIKKSFGDPVTVNQHDRPVKDSVEKWALELRESPERLALAHRIIEALDPADVRDWGYEPSRLFDALGSAQVNGRQATLPLLSSYRLKRQIMLALKRDIHENQFGRVVKKVRYYCDVLLRD
jgi:hypothetical protein